MQNPKHIVGVFGDRGGFNAAWPVLLRAIADECKISLYFTGTCKKQFLENQLSAPGAYIYLNSAGGGCSSDFFFEHLPADMLIVGASNSEASVRNTARAISDNWPYCPVVMIEDMYGSARPLLETPEGKLINRVYVVDEFAKGIIADLVHGEHRIIVSGGPHFDFILSTKNSMQTRKEELRKALNIQNDQYTFLVVGGLNDTAKILMLLEQGIVKSGLKDTSKVMLRQHPRATDEDKALTEQYLRSTSRRWFVEVDKKLAPTSDDLLPIAGFILSGYGTTNHNAILLGRPGVVYVGTPGIIKDHLREKGTERPPQVEARAAWYVKNGDEMADVIDQVLQRGRSEAVRTILANQEKIARLNDGKATNRVWADIQSMLD